MKSTHNILENLTLIIPTYNRPIFLERLLNYYYIKNAPFKLLILDSSDSESKELNHQSVLRFGAHATYIPFSSTTAVATKLHDGLKLVTTPYTAFCADDDLVFIEGLAEALAFLQKNPQYVCVDGIYLNFNILENDVHLVIEYATKGISGEDPGARVFQLYQKYESLFYGVFKTKDALAIFSGVSKNSSLHYQELFQATSALLLGKSHRLPIFYAARQHCNPAEPNRDKWQTYYWFADNSKEFLEHYLSYRNELWYFYHTHVVEKNYTQEEFFKVMDIAHAMYFGIGCPPAYFHSVLQDKWPSDPYKKSNAYQDNVCNLLKNKHRNVLENYFNKFSTWFSKKLSEKYSIRDVKNLNKITWQNSQKEWQCHLSKELRWLASVPLFRKTYQELCLYLDNKGGSF